MPVRKRTVTDGITSDTAIVISAPRSPLETRQDTDALRAIVEEHNRRATFDGLVVELERTCRQIPRSRGADRLQGPAYGSRAWYADAILSAIHVVRDALARHAPQLATAEAVRVGALAAEAEAKFRWGDLLLRRARRTKNRELSQRSVRARREATAERDTAIAVEARTYREKHPRPSIRQMAQFLSGSLDMPVGTVRDRLRKLGIR